MQNNNNKSKNMSNECNCLKLCVERAMKHAKNNNYSLAINSFVSDIRKTDCTKNIFNNSDLYSILEKNKGNLNKFKNVLLSFKICCVCKNIDEDEVNKNNKDEVDEIIDLLENI